MFKESKISEICCCSLNSKSCWICFNSLAWQSFKFGTSTSLMEFNRLKLNSFNSSMLFEYDLEPLEALEFNVMRCWIDFAVSIPFNRRCVDSQERFVSGLVELN
ncbi:hypothetical protein WICPIJ_005465 [Wickerhamomyces pijperi]|uniref:Uncharacterized protein n=1 Tax=Wickerhamomyces pijperi TaxID=599730 RepID=A0A9P8TLX4_WICPI|nr:hypothetical protein WICPIJ_005465 [Wickerhamomyces pijperi]